MSVKVKGALLLVGIVSGVAITATAAYTLLKPRFTKVESDSAESLSKRCHDQLAEISNRFTHDVA